MELGERTQKDSMFLCLWMSTTQESRANVARVPVLFSKEKQKFQNFYLKLFAF